MRFTRPIQRPAIVRSQSFCAMFYDKDFRRAFTVVLPYNPRRSFDSYVTQAVRDASALTPEHKAMGLDVRRFTYRGFEVK